MNFLKLTSEAKKQFKRRHAQYWLDQLVGEVLERQRRAFQGEGVLVTGQALAVLRNPALGLELIIPGINIVTDKGDKYYAQSICAESPTDDFDGASSGLRMGSNATAPTKSDNDVGTFLSGTDHALDATYERTSDPDGDNTGSGVDVVTWRYSYTTAQGNASNIQEGAIVDNKTTPTGALTHFLFAASFNKTSSDTLKVFVNHTQTGV